MNRWHLIVAVLALGLSLVEAGKVSARTPSVRTQIQPSTGARTDITVPYLANGKNAFQGYAALPLIYSSPTVDDPKNPQARKVYNLPFYGGTQSYGDKSNGAESKPKKFK